MSEMQERVAQALKDAGLREDHDIRLALATAAIEAMREPTKVQELVMHELLERSDRPPTKRWHWVWHEMIEAALGRSGV